jgi:hypothetical protein
MELLFNGYRVSFMQDENTSFIMDGGDRYPVQQCRCTILNTKMVKMMNLMLYISPRFF